MSVWVCGFVEIKTPMGLTRNYHTAISQSSKQTRLTLGDEEGRIIANDVDGMEGGDESNGEPYNQHFMANYVDPFDATDSEFGKKA